VNTNVNSRPWVLVGLLFVSLGLILNQWVIASVMTPEGFIEYAPFKLVIWSLEIILVCTGVSILKYRSTNLPKSIILAVVSLFAVLLILEFILRVAAGVLDSEGPDFRRAHILYEFQRTTQYHPTWGWSFRPNIDSVWEEDWKGRERTLIKINFRTRPIPGYPQYGMRDDGLNGNAETIIPVFGDSFSFGSTIELEEIWAELIENRNPEIDMLNLASGGGLTKAVEQYAILRDLLPSHDVVIYQMWLGNEFFDNYAFPGEQARAAEIRSAHLAETQKRRLQSASYLAYIVFESVDNIQKAINSQQTEYSYVVETDQLWDDEFGNFLLYPANPILLRYTEPDYFDERIAEGIQNTDDALLRMKSLVGDRKLVIILFPFKEQLYEEIVTPYRQDLDLAKPDRIVMSMCADYKIFCIDLLPALEKYKYRRLYWDYDPHFTPVGQFYASIEAESILKNQGIMPTK
jgi:hypothetical protein